MESKKPHLKKAKVINEIPVLHSCTQTAALRRQKVLLERLSEVTLGNGHPEDGLLFMVRKFVGEHEVVLTDLKDIKEKLSTVNEINTELEVQRRVKIEKEKILSEIKRKEELESNEIIKKEEINITKKSLKWSSIGVIAAIISVAVLAIFNILNYNINKQTKLDTSEIKESTEITNDVLIPLNKRGQYYDPFGNDTLNK